MPTQNVNLQPHQANFIRKSVKQGRFKNASEVVRAGLRLLEQQEAEDKARLQALQRIAKDSFDALDRGEFTTVTADSLESMFDRVDRKIRARK